MKRKPKAPKLIKTSISIPEVLMDFAVKQCEKRGFSSFSAYLASLIRDQQDLARRPKSSGLPYPLPKPITNVLEETPKKKTAL